MCWQFSGFSVCKCELHDNPETVFGFVLKPSLTRLVMMTNIQRQTEIAASDIARQICVCRNTKHSQG